MKQPEPRILIIDDNPAIHEDFEKILVPAGADAAQSLGEAESVLFGTVSSGAFPAPVPGAGDRTFRLFHALNGQDGLAQIETAQREDVPIGVAFVDMRMPNGWDGLETADRLLKADPELQIVICTAYSDYSWDEIRHRLGRSDGLLILKKPFDVVEVLQLAHNLTRKWELSREARGTIAELDGRVEESAAALRSSHQRIAAMFRCSPWAQMIVDRRGPHGVEVNEALCRLTGVTMEKWRKPEHAMEIVNASGLADILRWNHPVTNAESVLFGADGDEKNIILSSAVLDVDGEPALLLMMKDITERKRLECDLRQMQKMEAVGQLAAGIAHDFNNLLTVISGNAQLARQSYHRGVEIEELLLEEILESSARATDLTRQLLAFSRRQVFQPRLLNLNQMAENQLSFLSRLLGEHVEILWRPDAALGFVTADIASIEQVLLNLSINARDAMPDGGRLTLATEMGRIDTEEDSARLGVPKGDYVCLTCSDTGHGMAPEIASRIFEPFFTTKETGKGTGLGLASVYGIIQRHRGAIEVTSAIEEGTTFRVWLPLETAVHAPAGDARRSTAPMTPHPGSENGEGDGGLRVLLVEDEPAVRRIALRLLRSLGHHAIEAIDGHSGLARWREHRHDIDLVVTDMVMPGGMSGLQLAETLQGERPDLPIILASGYSNEILRDDSIAKAPLRRFLPKPYDQGSLRQAIESLPVPTPVDLENLVTLPG